MDFTVDLVRENEGEIEEITISVKADNKTLAGVIARRKAHNKTGIDYDAEKGWKIAGVRPSTEV